MEDPHCSPGEPGRAQSRQGTWVGRGHTPAWETRLQLGAFPDQKSLLDDLPLPKQAIHHRAGEDRHCFF